MPLIDPTCPIPLKVKPSEHLVNRYWPVIELNRNVSPVLSSWRQMFSRTTVTVKLHDAVSPCELVAEQKTVVTPGGNACGEVTGTLLMVQLGVSGAPVHGSFDVVTVKLTVAVV
jgi:hypothetical protein